MNFTGDPRDCLLDFLRNQLFLTGTKEGCGEGICGSCKVLLDGKPVKACVTSMARVEDRNVQTIEGVGSAASPHPLQQAFVEKGLLSYAVFALRA